MPPEEIALQIHGQGIESHEITTPMNLEAGEFIRELVATLGLPQVGGDGKPLVWEVDDKETGKTLVPERTLQENGVRAGHHLYLNRRPAPPPPPPPEPPPPDPGTKPLKMALLVAIALIPVAGAGSYFWTSGQKQRPEGAITAANQRASAAEAQVAQLNALRQKDSVLIKALREGANSKQAQIEANEAQNSKLRAAATRDQNQIKGLQATIQSLQATPQSSPRRPSYGWLTWTGNIPKGNVVEIRDNTPTVGLLSGSRLPGTDCTVEAPDPERVSIEARPDAGTAWNRIVFRVKGKGKTTVHLLWVIK